MNRLRLLLLAVGLGTAGLALPAHALAAGPTKSVAQSGSLKLCKVGGAGVAVGDAFTFSLTTQTVTRTVTVAAGSCTTLLVGTRATALTQGFFANHLNAVGALLGSGVTLEVDSAQLSAAQVQAILTTTAGKPGGVTASSNALLTLAQQLLAADLNVLRGLVAPPSVLAAIAQASSGIQITVNGNAIQLTTSLSTARLSSLTETLTAFNEGRVGGPGSGAAITAIFEAPVANTKVSAIACNPAAACTNIDLPGRTVTATVSTGATTEVRFTNVGTVGSLKLCKVAGNGVTAGTLFTFDVIVGTDAPKSVTIAAGECTTVKDIPDGSSVKVAETLASSFRVFSITCSPGCSDINLNGGTATTTIKANVESAISFTNESNLGNLKLCKVAGNGISAGTNFAFTVTPGGGAAQTVTVAAGDCVFVNGILDGTSVVVTETLASSFRVFSITCNPGCSNIDLNGATATITIKRNTDAVLTFTNESNLGNLKLCKVAGNGISAGTNFAFTVTPGGGAAQTVTVAAGDCVFVNGILDGTSVVVTETLASSFRVFSITCNPGCSNIDLNGATATITIKRNTDAVLTFTNESNLGNLKLCKVAGNGISAGTNFTFTVTPAVERRRRSPSPPATASSSTGSSMAPASWSPRRSPAPSASSASPATPAAATSTSTAPPPRSRLSATPTPSSPSRTSRTSNCSDGHIPP